MDISQGGGKYASIHMCGKFCPRELVDLLLLRNISMDRMTMLGMELTGRYGRRSMLRENTGVWQGMVDEWLWNT